MSEQKCLPGCQTKSAPKTNYPGSGIQVYTVHAPGCPNAEPAPKMTTLGAALAKARPALPTKEPEGEIDWAYAEKWAIDAHPGIDKGDWMIARAYLALREKLASVEAELRIEKEAGQLAAAFSGRDQERREAAELREKLAASEAESTRRLSLIQQYEKALPEAKAKLAAAEARVESLESLIVAQSPTNWAYHPKACCCVFCEERNAIKARRQNPEGAGA